MQVFINRIILNAEQSDPLINELMKMLMNIISKNKTRGSQSLAMSVSSFFRFKFTEMPTPLLGAYNQ